MYVIIKVINKLIPKPIIKTKIKFEYFFGNIYEVLPNKLTIKTPAIIRARPIIV